MKSANLLHDLPSSDDQETFETLLSGDSFELERIVSNGQATPPGEWLEQPRGEWVVLLRGSAELRIDDDAKPVELRPGDAVLIAARRRHRVERTDPQQPTVWLALHYLSDCSPRATSTGNSGNS